MKFEEFGFNPKLMEGIAAIGYQNATPIQEQTIPIILKGRDVMGSAQTGTGKTAAFLLPVINNIITSEKTDFVKALIIVPTRELALQIDQQMDGFSYFTPVSSIAVYGGTDGLTFEREKKALTEGADIIICTPGRIIAHLNQGYVNLSQLKVLILDEADRMLDMGFYFDILKIITHLPKKRQNLLFAATMPRQIGDLARKILVNPAEINISVSKPAEKILQLAYIVYDNQKIGLVKHLLRSQNLRSILIFCSTKISTKQLGRELKHARMNVAEIHSDIEQSEREKVMLDFRSRKINIIVATDVISRGIDVEDIDLVINYDVPNDYEDYVHRIGRTARAETEGVAITLINQAEQKKFGAIERQLGKVIHKSVVPAEFGDVPAYEPEKFFRDPNKKHRPFKKKR